MNERKKNSKKKKMKERMNKRKEGDETTSCLSCRKS